MREVIKYYNDTLEKDETKIYYLDKKVSTPDTLFLYYKTKEKTKDEIEKEELKVAQEAIDYLIEIGGDI